MVARENAADGLLKWSKEKKWSMDPRGRVFTNFRFPYWRRDLFILHIKSTSNHCLGSLGKVE